MQPDFIQFVYLPINLFEAMLKKVNKTVNNLLISEKVFSDSHHPKIQ